MGALPRETPDGVIDDAAALQLLNDQRAFRAGALIKSNAAELIKGFEHTAKVDDLLKARTSRSFDTKTFIRALDPGFVAELSSQLLDSPVPLPTVCVVRDPSDPESPADVVCIDYDALGGTAAVLSWTDSNRSSAPRLLAIGRLRIDLAALSGRIQGVFAAPKERRMERQWQLAVAGWWESYTRLDGSDSGTSSEIGGIEPDELDEALSNSALEDNDPLKRD